ncbi:xanthine dehydrogenase family protein molybdopterin-binding subunit [Roseovarius sp. M141]|uniref:xanthine dehydrogenase family protein molybdopterin-binding subunit n=1 Tax=Roseovarius sp. M141 TaxID=2583806 RepID=UPI0020CD88C9|nr:xanthine dehydrogenase family protein molybdopterin-binding subunit [Roseovarius sp. M141]MCQ0092976.1 xanthine dehydrogenase family protein molybdopterin-binding subunit [Roseovarius sp. M141]
MTTDFRPHHSQALLRGAGQYCDDIALPGALRAIFLRSDVAAGRIAALDVSEVRAMPGVHAVHVGADVADLGALPVNEVLPLEQATPFPILAQGRVHAVGQPVAAILASSRAEGQDAAEAIWLDIAATEMPEPRHIAGRDWTAGDAPAAMAHAAHRVEAQVHHARLAPLSLEPRCIAVRPEPDGTVTIWQTTQTPHRTRSHLAAILGIDAARIRVIAPDVGGAFGMKASLYPEEVYCVWAALTLGVAVRWSASRSEEFLSATHGRGLTTMGVLGVDGTGRFTALTAEVTAPLGHWLPNSALIPAWNAARVLPGPYGIETVQIKTAAVQENRAPTGIYRGAGRPEAALLLERLVDKAARGTGIDPFEIRLRNLPPKDALPHMTATGQMLDSGDYAGALHLLRRVSRYDARAADMSRRRAAGELAGLGVALFLEPSGEGWESARVTWHANGRVEVDSGSSAQGQVRTRSYAAIAARVLGTAPEDVAVRYGDTKTCPEGIGAVASRSTPIGGSAVHEACSALRAARGAGENLPLSAEIRFETKGQAWGYGAYLVQLAIDRDTGKATVEAAICVDDAGNMIDAQAVADQIVGGFAQGMGEALMEALHYDEDGQLLTASLMDYAVPRADDMPTLLLYEMQTPSPMNPLGAKGVGEAGTIGAPAAILNAAIDALAPLGVTDLQMPLSPARLWQAINETGKGRDET